MLCFCYQIVLAAQGLEFSAQGSGRVYGASGIDRASSTPAESSDAGMLASTMTSAKSLDRQNSLGIALEPPLTLNQTPCYVSKHLPLTCCCLDCCTMSHSTQHGPSSEGVKASSTTAVQGGKLCRSPAYSAQLFRGNSADGLDTRRPPV